MLPCLFDLHLLSLFLLIHGSHVLFTGKTDKHLCREKAHKHAHAFACVGEKKDNHMQTDHQGIQQDRTHVLSINVPLPRHLQSRPTLQVLNSPGHIADAAKQEPDI
jgi:hypothetical protein